MTEENNNKLKTAFIRKLPIDYNLSTAEAFLLAELLDAPESKLLELLDLLSGGVQDEEKHQKLITNIDEWKLMAIELGGESPRKSNHKEMMLEIFDLVTDNHGVKYQTIDTPKNEYAPEGIYFSQTSKTHHPTLLLVVIGKVGGQYAYLDYCSVSDFKRRYM